MNWPLLIILCVIVVGCSYGNIVNVADEKADNPIQGTGQKNEVNNMKLTSNAFEHNSNIPAKYTCQGEDINPDLKWEDVPSSVKSFALIFDDPDAPVGLWKHWLIKDIPADIRSISEDSTVGVEIVNSFRRESYGGPCPPNGEHRYFFKLYALDVEKLGAVSMDEIYDEVEKHKIEEAVLMGKYEKG